jgi:hypothetical protein
MASCEEAIRSCLVNAEAELACIEYQLKCLDWAIARAPDSPTAERLVERADAERRLAEAYRRILEHWQAEARRVLGESDTGRDPGVHDITKD